MKLTISSRAEKDLKKLKEGFLAKLKDQVKHPIQFQLAQDFGYGFTISFDNGRSCFDFTDKSLAEFLSQYLNQELSLLLKESITEK